MKYVPSRTLKISSQSRQQWSRKTSAPLPLTGRDYFIDLSFRFFNLPISAWFLLGKWFQKPDIVFPQALSISQARDPFFPPVIIHHLSCARLSAANALLLNRTFFCHVRLHLTRLLHTSRASEQCVSPERRKRCISARERDYWRTDGLDGCKRCNACPRSRYS